jgi:N-acetylglucosaminyldiphosphoundecaprenol N-acetyl-beta-D-mannosaminyltransferase
MRIVPISLLGQRVDQVSTQQVRNFLQDRLHKKQKTLLFAMNIHILLQLEKEKTFKKEHQQADIIFADGVPLLWFSHFTGHPLSERVSGTDLVESLLQQKKWRIYVIGPPLSTINSLQMKFPRTVCGFYTPPFGEKWNSAVNKKILKEIDQKKPEIIFVAVGPLKQEKWLLNFFSQTPAIIGMGVGSALEILAGEKPRAPKLMKDYGFEWLWRVLLEPKRLFKRYVYDFFAFSFLIFSTFQKRWLKRLT